MHVRWDPFNGPAELEPKLDSAADCRYHARDARQPQTPADEHDASDPDLTVCNSCKGKISCLSWLEIQ